MAILSTLKTPLPYHLFAFSLVFGATIYQSFYAGIRAYQALPLEQFSALQAKTFPGYFAIQTAASAFLLLSPPVKYSGGAATAVYVGLGSVLASGVINLGVISPKTRVVMEKRKAQEALEGKSHKDPTASQDMKDLNKQFGKIHGISVLFNLAAVAGLVVYGVVLSDGLAVLKKL